MATNYTDTNWCPRCEGACEVKRCDPHVRSVICSEDCRCPVVQCGLCRGIGYIGCTICGVAFQGDDVQRWRDGEGDHQCQACATDDGRKPAVAVVAEPPRAAFEAFKRGLPYSVTMLHIYLVSQTLGAF